MAGLWLSDGDYAPSIFGEAENMSSEAEGASSSVRRLAEEEKGSERKVYKHSEDDVPERSPKSPKRGLFPPNFAGDINQVTFFEYEGIQVFAEEDFD